MCVCSLRYPSCNAHAPYCHLWPARLNCIFPHYLINGTIFGGGGGGDIEHKMSVLIFSATFFLNVSRCKKKWARYNKKMYIGLRVKCPLFLYDFHETWISSTDFRKKFSNIRFHENPSSGSRIIPCGQTDRHDETNNRFPQLCERDYKRTEPTNRMK